MNEVAEVSGDLNTVASSSAGALILDARSMDSMIRVADLMASGKSTLPQHFRGSSGDCLAVVMQSMQWGLNPFAVAQKTHLVNGTLGYEAQLVSAVISSSGILTKDDFDYEFFGPWEKVIGKYNIKKGDKGEYRVPGWSMADEEGCGVRVSATIRATGTVKVLETLLAQAGVRNSTLWASDPQQQLGYLAVKKWARRHAPGVILGVYTPDELDQAPAAPQTRDMGKAEVVAPEVPQALIDQADKAVAAGVVAYSAFWSATGKENRVLLAGRHEGFKAAAARADESRTIDQPAQDAAPAADHTDFVAGLDAKP
jgi:hypothetical protein